MTQHNIDISVVVPVFNVAPFIGRCVESLFSQTLRDGVEFLFVDDATPDKSMSIVEHALEKYPCRKEQVRILHHSENKGLPAARNTGLAEANGEYVLHCDSDDFMEPDTLEVLLRAARDNDADIVWCDWFLSLAESERVMRQPSYKSSAEALAGMLSGAMKYNVWNKLARRSLYIDNNITFPSGHGMGEDMTMIMVFACANKVCHLSRPLYHYVRQNTAAFTQMDGQTNPRHLSDLRYNVNRTIDFLVGKFDARFEKECAFFMLEAKFPFLLTNDKSSYQRWHEWFPEANRFIMQNNNISFRSRLLQFMAAKGQFWYVRLYYFLLFRVAYGIIYR